MKHTLTELKMALGITSAISEFVESLSRIIDFSTLESFQKMAGRYVITDYYIPADVAKVIIKAKFKTIDSRIFVRDSVKSKKSIQAYNYSIRNFPTIESLYAVFCDGKEPLEVQPASSEQEKEKVDELIDKVFDTAKATAEAEAEEPTEEDLTPPELKKVDLKLTYGELAAENERIGKAYNDLNNRFKTFEQYATKAINFMNAVSVSPDCVNITTFHRVLRQNGVEMSEKDFFEWLRNEGYIKNSADNFERNIPTEFSITNGLMNVREVIVTGSGSNTHIAFTPKITGKGQIHLLSCFNLKREDIKEYGNSN